MNLIPKPLRNRPVFRSALVLAGMSLALLPAALAFAEPSFEAPAEAAPRLGTLEQQAESFRQELAALDRGLEIVVEQHNAAREKLDQLTRELNDSRLRLESARAERAAQEAILADRLTAIYKGGDFDLASVLVNSSSLNDFFEQTYYLARINEQDARMEKQYEATAKRIEGLTDEIDRKRADQLQLEKHLEEQKQAIEDGIAQRQKKLAEVDSQIQTLLAQEAERQRAEQARLAEEAGFLLADLKTSDATQAQVVETSLRYLGVPYVWGGESPSGMDCSGLTKYVYAQHGVSLPHNAAMQFNLGVPVPNDQLQPGDLIFWGPGEPHHVAMYIGQGKYIEAPTFNEVVKISTLAFDDDYAGARRFPLEPRS